MFIKTKPKTTSSTTRKMTKMLAATKTKVGLMSILEDSAEYYLVLGMVQLLLDVQDKED